MMITLYLDMDGVLANFDKAYRQYDPQKEDRKRFRQSVLDYKIFEDLELMPDALELLNHVAKLRDVNVEILTSCGTHEPLQAQAAKDQKKIWLAKHNISYKPNFSHSKQEKAKWATPQSILIDDSAGCVAPFIAAGGQAILHKHSSETIRILDSIILQMRAVEALRS